MLVPIRLTTGILALHPVLHNWVIKGVLCSTVCERLGIRKIPRQLLKSRAEYLGGRFPSDPIDPWSTPPNNSPTYLSFAP